MYALTETQGEPVDVFTAARLLDDMWNRTARAVAVDEIERQCDTSDSGYGRGRWEEVGLFRLLVKTFKLKTSKNYEGRNELVLTVPLALLPAI